MATTTGDGWGMVWTGGSAGKTLLGAVLTPTGAVAAGPFDLATANGVEMRDHWLVPTGDAGYIAFFRDLATANGTATLRAVALWPNFGKATPVPSFAAGLDVVSYLTSPDRSSGVIVTTITPQGTNYEQRYSVVKESGATCDAVLVRTTELRIVPQAVARRTGIDLFIGPPAANYDQLVVTMNACGAKGPPRSMTPAGASSNLAPFMATDGSSMLVAYLDWTTGQIFTRLIGPLSCD